MHLPQIDKYAHIKSFFSLWDPRVKIISLSFLTISIALVSNHLGALLGLILAITFIYLSKIPPTFVLKQLKWVIIFVLLLFVIMVLTVPKEIGLKLATLIVIRAISICMLIFVMIGTTKFHTTLKALSHLKFPNILTQLLMFTYRYIFVFIEEAKRMFICANARLFKKKTNIYTLKVTSNLVGMLFIRGFEKTEKVYNAMVSRGYKGSLKIHYKFNLCFMDFLKATLIITTACLLHLSSALSLLN